MVLYDDDDNDEIDWLWDGNKYPSYYSPALMLGFPTCSTFNSREFITVVS